MSISTPPFFFSLDAILRGKYEFYPIFTHLDIAFGTFIIKEYTKPKRGRIRKRAFCSYIKKNIVEAQHPIDNQKSSELIKF